MAEDIGIIEQKMQQYCNYRERCLQEVKEKLNSMKISHGAAEKIIDHLTQEDFLNEERFALAFAGGKFRVNKWGKIKIKAALRQKKIPEYFIEKALAAISEEEYRKTIQKLQQNKARAIKEENALQKQYKIMQYLINKGFETNLIKEFYE